MIIEIYFHHLVTRRLWKCSQIYVNLLQLKPQYQWQTQQWMSMSVTTVQWSAVNFNYYRKLLRFKTLWLQKKN